jgi:hypothetical protein
MKLCVLAMCLTAAACATPIETPDQPATSSETSALGNACSVSCRNASIQCNATCDRFPRPNCEENCDQRFSNCMHVCGCPFTDTFDRVSPDHADATSTFICVGPLNSSGVVYQRYNTFVRTDHIQETLQCDGLTTQTVLSSTVSSAGPCYHRLFPDQTCVLTQTTTAGLCTF